MQGARGRQQGGVAERAPGPPNFGLSRQKTHTPQSATLSPGAAGCPPVHTVRASLTTKSPGWPTAAASRLSGSCSILSTSGAGAGILESRRSAALALARLGIGVHYGSR